MSFWHFFVDFVNFGDRTHIAKLEGKWHVTVGQAAWLANHWSLALRVKWFRLALQQYLKDCCVDFKAVTTRPLSSWLKCHRGCLNFPIKEEIFSRVESWFGDNLGAPAIGQGEALGPLPDPVLT